MVGVVDSQEAHRAQNFAVNADELALPLQWIARQLGKHIEIARIQRVLADISRAEFDGSTGDWRTILVESGRSLGLHLRTADCTPEDLQSLLTAGNVAIALTADDQELIGLKRSHRRRLQALRFSDLQLQTPSLRQRRCWSVVIAESDALVAHEPQSADPHAPVSPLIVLWQMLRPELKDIVSAVAISGVAGLLLLSIPVTAQQLVRNVTFATLYQPIIVLSLVLLGLLGFVAALQMLHIYTAEIIQRRLYARVAAKVARHLPWVTPEAQHEHDLPELMNRFLDVGIIQKTLASLIVDGVAIVLSTVIGMSVMAFYHPFLLGYDLMLLLCLTVVIFVLGRGGIRSAIQESKAKYQTVAWLQDLAANCSVVQEYQLRNYAAETTDVMVIQYLKKRRAHFRILIRQVLVVLGTQALATTTLLGLGGYLVLQEQLTLGQLVAAELIVATIVASFAKLGKHIESWYDLLAAVDKVAHLTDLPVVTLTGTMALPRQGGVLVELLRHVSGGKETARSNENHAVVTKDHRDQISISPGQIEVLYDWADDDRMDVLQAFRDPATASEWSVKLDGLNLHEIRPDARWLHVAILDTLSVFPGTVAENVHLHRSNVTDVQVRRILKELGLTSELQDMHVDLDAPLGPHGSPLSVRQLHKLHLARALAGQPRLLVLDHWLDVLGDEELQAIVPRLRQLSPQTTWLILTAQRRVVESVAAIPTAVQTVENVNHD